MSVVTELQKYEQIAIDTNTARQALIANINTQGGTVAETAGLNDAVAEVLNIPTGSDDPTRPEEWLAMPDIGPTEEKFAGLLHIAPGENKYFTLQFYDTVIVTIGNNEPFELSSGTIYSGRIGWTDCDAQTTMNNGWRQVLVTAVPKVGSILRFCYMISAHADVTVGYPVFPWVDVVIGSPNLTRLLLSGDNPKRGKNDFLCRVKVISHGDWDSGMQSAMYQTTAPIENLILDCQSTSWTTLNWSGDTNNYRFNKIRNVSLTNTGNLGNMYGAFRNWYCLVTCKLDNASGFSNTSYMFSYCYRLEELELPDIAIGFSVSGTSMGKTALERLFANLATVETSPTLDIRTTPGAATCDDSIATAKGWIVTKV